MKGERRPRRNGIILALVTTMLVVLKLEGVIGWSWWGVLAPVWVPLVVGLLGMAVLWLLGE